MTIEQRLRGLEREVAELRGYTPRIPLRQVARRDTVQILRIIGGQLASGVSLIQYSATDPTLAQSYDPATDTSYPVGMGNAELWMDGAYSGRVLVRHDFAGFPSPLMAGDDYLANGTATLTVATGASAGTSLAVYRVKRG